MCTYYDICAACSKPCDDVSLFGSCSESVKAFNNKGVACDSLCKGAKMLFRKNCGRHQYRNLLPIINRFEGRPDC